MDGYISAKEAAAYLGISIWTLYSYVFRRLIPYYKLRTGKKGKLLFKKPELKDFVEAGKVEPNGKYL